MRFLRIKQRSKRGNLISKGRRILAGLTPTSARKGRDWLGRTEETGSDWLGRKPGTGSDWLGRKRR